MTQPYEMTWVGEPPAPEPPVSHARAVAVGVATLLLGAPAGLFWARLSPPLRVVFSASGPGVPDFDDGMFFQTDGMFLVVTMLAGVVCGLAGWFAGRRQGPGVPVALAAGSLGAARVAQVVGERVVADGRLRGFCATAAENGLCSLYDGTPDLRSAGLVVVWATAALLTFSIATLTADREVVSSG